MATSSSKTSVKEKLMNKKRLFLTFALVVLSLLFTRETSGQWLKKKLGNFLADRVRTKNQNLQIKAKKQLMQHDGRERSYYVYEPTTWDKKSEIPLVFLFHGGGGNARNTIYYYQLEETAEKHGFLLVAPNGTGAHKDVLLTWNVNFGFGYAYEKKVDDTGFIKNLLEKLLKDYHIDEKRIYATGMSNGAFFCHLLAAQPWNRLAAIAPVVGSLGGKEIGKDKLILPPEPAAPVSVLLIQGVLDKSVPLNGGMQKRSIGKARYLTSASDTIRFWAKANDFKQKPAINYKNELKATSVEYQAGKNNTSLIAYYIDNCGHAWPGSRKKPHKKADDIPPQFPANEIIWKFFAENPRP
jgi:polyhydroxybutyrate depolymerase